MDNKVNKGGYRQIKAIGALVMLTTLLLACYSCVKEEKPSIADQELNVYYIVSATGGQFYDELYWFEEKTDEAGNSYLIGVLDPELDALLGNLVETYNSDPTTTRPIEEDTARHLLTEELIETMNEDRNESAFYDFLRWLAASADLEYIEDVSYGDSSNIVARAGDPVPNNITNYYYVLNRSNGAYTNYKYVWE